MCQNRVTVEKAAELLGLSVLTVRWGLINGTLPIGSYIKNGNSKRTVYHISPGALAEYLQIPVNELFKEELQ